MKLSLQAYQQDVEQALDRARKERIGERIWDRDHTIWSPSPEEISNRLGWLDIAGRMRNEVASLRAFADEVRAAGYRRVILLGMGGSSLAPELFFRTFGATATGLRLDVLDTTDPDVIRLYSEDDAIDETLFIVATKSGGTVETLSLFKYFYRLLVDRGVEDPGGAFIGITDPGSRLEELGRELGFRRIFINDPTIGGRYSALSFFGLVPAALIGVDLVALLENAAAVADACRPFGGAALDLGVALGVLALAGRDKVTFLTSGDLAGFADWAEQLIAESTGKMGRGILPVVGEPAGSPDVYAEDRVFVHLGMAADGEISQRVEKLSAAGHPVIEIRLDSLYDIGGQFFMWELGTAVAGHILGIQPFDQPNVEAAKALAREMTSAYLESGVLPDEGISPPDAAALLEFVEGCSPGGYIALQAYTSYEDDIRSALQRLRIALRDRTGLAVTLGFGPRYLHSTGQLHKGDAGRGRFIQFLSTTEKDLIIPDTVTSSSGRMTFGVLKRAQALGDFRALQAAEPPRSVLRVDLGSNPVTALRNLLSGVIGE